MRSKILTLIFFLSQAGCAMHPHVQALARLRDVNGSDFLHALQLNGYRSGHLGQVWQNPDGTRVFVMEEGKYPVSIFLLSEKGALDRFDNVSYGQWVNFDGQKAPWPGLSSLAVDPGWFCPNMIGNACLIGSEEDRQQNSQLLAIAGGGGDWLVRSHKILINNPSMVKPFMSDRFKTKNCTILEFVNGRWARTGQINVPGKIISADPRSDVVVLRDEIDVPIQPRGVTAYDLSSQKSFHLGYGMDHVPLFLDHDFVNPWIASELRKK